jgi:hypothetical protein
MVKLSSWSDIRKHYARYTESLPELRSMVQLIERIEASPYANGVWAWTSMFDLCVAQMPVANPLSVGPYLRISPLHDGNIDFRYMDTAIKDRQWHRVVPAAEAFSRLERFFDQLNWFGRRA